MQAHLNVLYVLNVKKNHLIRNQEKHTVSRQIYPVHGHLSFPYSRLEMGRAIGLGFLVHVATRGLLVLLEEYFIPALCLLSSMAPGRRNASTRLPLSFQQELVVILLPLAGSECWRLVVPGRVRVAGCCIYDLQLNSLSVQVLARCR